MRRILAALILMLLPQFGLAQDRPNTILVLDSSGSMWGQIDGETKIDIARRVVTDLLQSIPQDQNLGLTVYGHRERGDCTDIESLVPPGPNTRDAIAAAVAGITPLGKTPMTDAVIAAAEELRYTEDRATVILVSDGVETCNPDPCAAARALEAAGIDFTVHVIGFDITDAEALRQMQCLADETGGLLRSASNADEFLAALTEVMAAPVPEPAPAPPVMATITLNAVLDDDLRTPFPDPLSWTVTGGEMPIDITETGNVVSDMFGPGTYRAMAMSVVDFSVGTENFTVVGNGDIIVTVVMSAALPLATIDAPDQAPAGSTIMVGWTGPDENLDTIEVGLPGDPSYLSYAYTRDGNPVALILPGQPGVYELRYKLHDAEVLVTRTITVTVAPVVLTAPQTAPIGSTIDVGWTGPAAQNDNIELGRVGESGYIDYAYVKDGNPVQIILPAEPGLYELRYRFRDQETILARPITVTAAEVSLSAPDTAPAGSTIDVGWVGPNAENDNIQIARPGGTYLSYAYVRDGNPVQLRLPSEPGSYELHYSFRDSDIIATRAIELTPISAQLLAQPTAQPGQPVVVGWDGPDYQGDYVAIGVPGDPGYDNYAATSAGNPVTLVAPATPGNYELRYITGDTVLTTVPLEVK